MSCSLTKTSGRLTTTQGEISILEDRTLTILGVGLNDDYLNGEQLLTTSSSIINAEYPFGDLLSTMNLTLSIKYVRNNTRDLFVGNMFTEAQWNETKQAYFIPAKNFQNGLTVLSIPDSLVKYYLIVINFAFPGSPFGKYPVYINYTTIDHDSQKKSFLRPYSDYGVTFTNEKKPTLGLIVSTDHPTMSDYPSILKLMDGIISQGEWNSRLNEVIRQALWSRINPSPVIRYSPHNRIVLQLSLIMMDDGYTGLEIQAGVNQTLIIEQIKDLTLVSEVSSSLVMSEASMELKGLANTSTENYFRWVQEITNYLTEKANHYWINGWDYPQPYEITKELPIYVAIMAGKPETLPWSNPNAGITNFRSLSSEYGGLVLITMNYEQLYGLNEGLTLTTLHELGHVFGLPHPHEYWDTNDQQVYDSWAWGYAQTPMTYLLTDYTWDFFDYTMVWREQMQSLLQQLKDTTMREEVLYRIRQGLYTDYTTELLALLTQIQQEKVQSEEELIMMSMVIPVISLLSFGVIIGVIRKRKW